LKRNSAHHRIPVREKRREGRGGRPRKTLFSPASSLPGAKKKRKRKGGKKKKGKRGGDAVAFAFDVSE